MLRGEQIALICASVLLVVVIVREVTRRLTVRYEYRFDSFAIHGMFGRQLFQIRKSEIESLTPAGIGLRLGGVKAWPRSQFSRKVVIKGMVRRPIIISWEGEPIAGLTPEGFKTRSRPAPRRRHRR